MYYGAIDKDSIRKTVGRVCKCLGNGTNNSADKLVLGTIAQETHFGQYRDKTEFKAGSGLCQFDRVGFDEVKLRMKETHKKKIYDEFGIDLEKVTYEMLEYNAVLSIIFCRLYYKRIPFVIPETLEGIAEYWKNFYNTEAGKGTEEEFIRNFKKYVEGYDND